MGLFNKNKIVLLVIRYFRFVLGGVVVLLLFISFYFILWPKYSEINDQGGLDYKSKVKLLESRKQELSQLQDLEKKYSQITSAEKEKLRKILPSSKYFSDLFVQMENLAKESGLIVSRISITEEGSTGVATDTNGSNTGSNANVGKTIGGIGTLGISLSVEGDNSYPALKIFLDNVEDNMRIVDMDSLSYSPPSEETPAFTVNLKTYYLED
ncbi:MAG: hypothetical protein COY66_01580 [Candidatus Kerfeldbacteria bacterium CG_4_10_14_0_8_um_filter_42_10]|uniref:Type 4a pilus biogenesis protein PilO n=1 Tax=Candidatus Kerfeldbacteria bacterium CG_4_10_14_0_8_um_filter_42_10 TaxID=2014248 RepID=A0A2M7RK07_9BACT|nr:MAG: hypothetical protein COY66_01580 [Candidatus Kerfeldbacteria bacterium CG_4_10_14_0_8_um_filter_42_10]